MINTLSFMKHFINFSKDNPNLKKSERSLLYALKKFYGQPSISKDNNEIKYSFDNGKIKFSYIKNKIQHKFEIFVNKHTNVSTSMPFPVNTTTSTNISLTPIGSVSTTAPILQIPSFNRIVIDYKKKILYIWNTNIPNILILITPETVEKKYYDYFTFSSSLF